MLADGQAPIAEIPQRWSTVGLYEVAGERIAACWLLPLNPQSFETIWSPSASSQPSILPGTGNSGAATQDLLRAESSAQSAAAVLIHNQQRFHERVSCSSVTARTVQ